MLQNTEFSNSLNTNKTEQSKQQNLQPTVLKQTVERNLASQAHELLKDLVSIDSVTSNHIGVNEVQTRLAHELTALGFEIELQRNPRNCTNLEAKNVRTSTPQTGYLLVATLKGYSENWVTLVSHADVVLGQEQVGEFRVKGDYAYGPGVIDNKGGLVVALLGLKILLEKHPPSYNIRFVCSPNEEVGSIGFHDLFRSYGSDSKVILGFEPALDNGSIVSSRRGNRWYQLRVQGREAHAGRTRGEHLNAAHELALKISKMHQLNDSAKGLAVNVGAMSGGRDKFNVVCGFAEAKIDTRFLCFQTRDELHEQMLSIIETKHISQAIDGTEVTTEFEIVDDCPPFAASDFSKELTLKYVRIINQIEEQSVEAECAGGAGDVNYMSHPDTCVLDGLGPIGSGMHTKDECIYLPSLVTRAQALSVFLTDLHI